MSDGDLRRLERVWRATGNPQTAARWLRERARTPSGLRVRCRACEGRGHVESVPGNHYEAIADRLNYTFVVRGQQGGVTFSTHATHLAAILEAQALNAILPRQTDELCSGCQGEGTCEWPWDGDTGRIALAALAGSEGARLVWYNGGPCVCGEGDKHNSVWPPHSDGNPESWLDCLEGFPNEVLLVAAIAAARGVLDYNTALEQHIDYPWRAEVVSILGTATAWLEDPTAERKQAWARAVTAAALTPTRHWVWVPVPEPADSWVLDAAFAGALVGHDETTPIVKAALLRWALQGSA